MFLLRRLFRLKSGINSDACVCVCVSVGMFCIYRLTRILAYRVNSDTCSDIIHAISLGSRSHRPQTAEGSPDKCIGSDKCLVPQPDICGDIGTDIYFGLFLIHELEYTATHQLGVIWHTDICSDI